MTEINLNLDTFLQSDSNRKKFTTFLKTVSTHQSIDNLLTLYLLICCFKNQNLNTDSTKLKQIFDKTYKTCILKHEIEIAQVLGNEILLQLSECLRTGIYNEQLLNQVKNSIKIILENEYLPMYTKPEKQTKKARCSSSSLTPVSSGLGSKSGSTLSLNQVPNPYNVITKPVKPTHNLETQSMFETRKTTKKTTSNITVKKSKIPRTAEKNPREFFNIISSKLENINLNNDSIDDQLDAHLNHVSRIKSSKQSRANQTLVHSIEPYSSHDNRNNIIKTTVAYYMPGETLAYISTINSTSVNLAQFKNLITKRGNFRYFFKTKTDLLEDECVVFQEETDDTAILPMFNDKIIAKIEYR